MITDASLWVGVFVANDVHHATSRQWLNRQVSAGATLVVPTLGMVEVAGAVARRTGSGVTGQSATRVLLATPGLRVVTLDSSGAEEAARIAATYFRRGADAVYVAVAAQLRLPLVTWDEELHRKAGTLVTVVRP